MKLKYSSQKCQVSLTSPLQCQVSLTSPLQCIFLSHSLRDVIFRRHRLSISSSQGFYEKIIISEIEVDEDLIEVKSLVGPRSSSN